MLTVCHSQSELFSAASCPTETESNSPKTKVDTHTKYVQVKKQTLRNLETVFYSSQLPQEHPNWSLKAIKGCWWSRPPGALCLVIGIRRGSASPPISKCLLAKSLKVPHSRGYELVGKRKERRGGSGESFHKQLNSFQCTTNPAGAATDNPTALQALLTAPAHCSLY